MNLESKNIRNVLWLYSAKALGPTFLHLCVAAVVFSIDYYFVRLISGHFVCFTLLIAAAFAL